MAAIVALAGLLALQAAEPARGEDFRPAAPMVLFVDVASGTTLLDREAKLPLAPGAVVKLMVLAAAAEAARERKIGLDASIPLPDAVLRRVARGPRAQQPFPVGTAAVPLRLLLQAVAVPFADDGALILAQTLEDSEAAFAKRMTALAKRLGMDASTFTNVTGAADAAQITTLADMGRLLRHLADKEPEVFALLADPVFTVDRLRQTNRNPLLALKAGVTGGAVFGTERGGLGVAVVAERDGQRMILAMFGLGTVHERNSEVRRILDWGFEAFDRPRIFEAGDIVGRVRVYGGEAREVALATAHPVAIVRRRDGSETLEARIDYRGPVPAPIARGTPLGALVILRNGAVADTVPLVTAEDVPAAGMTRRALDAITEIGVGLVWGERQK